MAKKKKVINIHPEIKSILNTFLTGFIPAFGAQLQTTDLNSLETSAIFGLLLVAIRVGVKYGLANLVKYIISWTTKYEIK